MLFFPWHFFRFWYFGAPSHFPYLFKNVISVFEDVLAVTLMARLLFVPLFHDVSLWGRILSFLFRFTRVIIGVLFLGSLAIFLVALLAIWIIFPLYLLLLPRFYGFLALGILFGLYYFWQKDKPPKNFGDFKKEVNLWQVATPKVLKFLKKGQNLYFLLFNLLSEAKAENYLQRLGLRQKLLLSKIKEKSQFFQEIFEKKEVLAAAFSQAVSFSSQFIDEEHLFLALVFRNKTLQAIFTDLNCDFKTIREGIAWYAENRQAQRLSYPWNKDFSFPALGGVNRNWIGNVTPTLDRYSRDLTLAAKKGLLPKTLKRKDLLSQIGAILARSGENNVLLIGEAGTGKTSLVYSLASWIIEGGVPEPLRFKRVVALDPGALLAGTKTEGDLSSRMMAIIEELEFTENVILFIDEVQNLLGRGERAGVIYASLEPHLTSTKFQVIGTTSFENYQKTLEKNAELANLFQNVEVPEASFSETLAILKIRAQDFERKQKVSLSYPSLAAAIELSSRYLHDRFLPEKAVSLLDEAAVLGGEKSPGGIVGWEEVAQVISQKTKIPLTQVTLSEAKRLLQLEEKLHQRMVNQNQAIEAVANALRRARLGLKEEKRPMASFLFVGPTGVGKTELAKTLAETYFGSEEVMIRLDMSEFQTKESLASLIGSPPGYGQEAGRFTEAVRRQPFSLVLIDEIEKAHPEILNLFLQVIDEARLTDSRGQTADFSNTIIIATSNAATPFLEAEIKKGADLDLIQKNLLDVLSQTFRLEFLNRFDGIILFRPLKIEEVEEIAKFMLQKLILDLGKKGIEVEINPRLLYALAEKGYQPGLGARPLRRLIQDKIEAKIAKEILGQKIKKGEKIILGEEFLAGE